MSDKAVENFSNILTQMLSLKPPGVSGSKIKALTEICIENVQSESSLIQKLYIHFKKTPGSHKLGVLYAVDSIVRAYIDEARKAGQDPTLPNPKDGTFSDGVHRITDILTSLMNDIMTYAPDDTKEKIKKLVDIWQRGSTFPAHILTGIRQKHFSTPQPSPTNAINLGALFPNTSANAAPAAEEAPAAAPANTAAILQALAQMTKGNTSTPPAPAAQPPAPAANPLANFAGLTNPTPPIPSSLQASLGGYGAQQQPAAPASNPLASLLPGLLGGNFGAQQAPQQQQQQQPSFPNYNNVPQQGNDPMQQYALLQMLQSMNPNQILELVNKQNQQPGAQYNQGWQQPMQNGYGGVPDRYGDDRRGGTFSPTRDRFRRSRSRSPGFEDGPVRRRSPVYGEYSGNGAERDRDYNKRGRGGRAAPQGNTRGGYRRDRTPTPPRQQDAWGPPKGLPPGQKFVQYDPNLLPDKIRVFSRTLFVGGVSSSEAELKQLFEQQGEVQSCIVNFEKRHAFIKMKTREDAVRAKEALETHRLPHSVLRTRWGVGFGPRDCCDYTTGVSEIALDRLTDADRRWLQTADFGGIGPERNIEPGLVLEEPDIEIGQGVSSKAISRRMQTDHSGARGPKSSFPKYDRDGGDYDRRGGESFATGANAIGAPEREIASPITTTMTGFGGLGANYMPLIYQQPGQQ